MIGSTASRPKSSGLPNESGRISAPRRQRSRAARLSAARQRIALLGLSWCRERSGGRNRHICNLRHRLAKLGVGARGFVAAARRVPEPSAAQAFAFAPARSCQDDARARFDRPGFAARVRHVPLEAPA